MQSNVTMFTGAGTGSATATAINPPSSGSGRDVSTTRLAISITTTAEILVEGTLDGSTWFSLAILLAAGLYRFDTSGLAGIRAYPTANGSGVTIKGTLVPGAASGPVVGVDDGMSDAHETTLPAGAPTYTAGDVNANTAVTGTCVFGSLVLARRPGALVRINGLRMSTDQAANVAQFRLYLFSKARANLTTATPVDDAAWLDAYTNAANFRGYTDLPAMAAGAGANTAARTAHVDPDFLFRCDPADVRAYFAIVTNTGYTRAAGQKIRVEASAVTEPS